MERRQGERRVERRRARDRTSATTPAAPQDPHARRRRALVALAVVAGLVLAVRLGFEVHNILGTGTAAPPELIGVWTTKAPGYTDRALEFTRSSVLLHTDEDHFTVHLIRRVTQTRHSLYTTFRIEYQDVDAVTPMVLRFIPSPHPLIQLEHFASVWRRVPGR
jgi:hypothetical protein